MHTHCIKVLVTDAQHMQPSLVPAGLVQNTTPGSTLIRLEIYIYISPCGPLGHLNGPLENPTGTRYSFKLRIYNSSIL